jgi:hypothetical protein
MVSGSVDRAATVRVSENVADLEKIAADAKAQAEREAQEKAEKERLAKEREEQYRAEREREEEEWRKRRAQRQKEEKEKKARQRARAKGWLEDEHHPERHEARTAREKWAAEALKTLMQLDPDYAAIRNDVGFNRSDGFIGHWFAEELPRGLTPRQWGLAIGLCRKYHGQVGKCPPREDGDAEEAKPEEPTPEPQLF